MARCSTFLVVVIFFETVASLGVTPPNLLFRMHLQIAKAANMSNCWVCSKPPPRKNTPAMAAVHAIYNFSVTAPMPNVTRSAPNQRLTIDFNPVFLDGNVSYAIYRDPKTCNDLAQPVWISGQLGKPSICFNISFRLQSHYLGQTTCPSGITVNLDNSGPTKHNITSRQDYLCLGDDCGIQEGGDIPNCIQMLYHSRNRREDEICVSLTGPYYFLCGRAAYRIVPRHAVGSCSLVRLVPASYIAVGLENKTTPIGKGEQNRTKRELFNKNDRAWAWFPAWTGWGIELMRRLNNYSSLLDGMFNETVSAIREISQEQRQIKTLLLQEKMALDYLLAAQGGFCKIFGEDCCTWIEDSDNQVQAHLNKVMSLQGEVRDISKDGWNPFNGLGGFGDFLYSVSSWFRQFGEYVLMFCVSLLLFYVGTRMACCLADRITSRRDAPIMFMELQPWRPVREPLLFQQQQQQHVGPAAAA